MDQQVNIYSKLKYVYVGVVESFLVINIWPEVKWSSHDQVEDTGVLCWRTELMYVE